ncbi:hypothetical protein ACCT32_34395, partial [Rhizobium brockwellii]
MAITVSARVIRPMIHQSHLGASHHSQFCASYGQNQIAYVHVNLSSRFSDSATFSYRSFIDSLINNNTQDRWRFERRVALMTYLKHDQLIAAAMLATTMTSLRQAEAAEC